MSDESRSFSQQEFDEVIRRATELAEGESDSKDLVRLSETEVLRIASEVGLPERHIRRALGEVRGGNVSDSDMAAMVGLFGPRTVRASRSVEGRPADMVKALDAFLVSGRLLQPVRKSPSLMVYQPAVDWASRISRFASSASKQYYIASAKKVEVWIEPEADGHSHVTVQVEPGTRDEYVTGGLIGGICAGAGTGVGLGAALGLGLLVPVGLSIGAGIAAGVGVTTFVMWVSGRSHKKKLLDVQLEVEGVLDRLETKEELEPPPASWRSWVRRHFHGVAREHLNMKDDLDL